MSASTWPGPTEGSWSTSPTISSAASSGTAASSDRMSGTSTIEVSSTTSRPQSSGFSPSRLNPPVRGSTSSRRWMVFASKPVASLTLTFLAGLRRDGLSAPCVCDGPINQRSFPAWVEQQRVPTLRPCDLVILDNLASHNGKAVRRAVRPADGCGSCLRNHRTSTRSSRPSPRSSTGCATLRSAPWRTPGNTWGRSLPPSNRASARTTSATPDRVRPKTDAL